MPLSSNRPAARTDRYFHYLKDKKIVFIGVGVTNNDCIRLFLQKGLHVTVCDKKTPEELGALYQEFTEAGARFFTGEDYLSPVLSGDCNVIFRAPGVYFHSEFLTKARQAGIIVTTEMEAFCGLCPCKLYGITGSDGKTTTTTLISEFLTASGKKVHKGGNIGRALLPVIEEISSDDNEAAVVELSSFQLLSMRQAMDVSVVTNVSPNHLDVHGTMEEYITAKKNIFLHQDAFSRTVLNADNPVTAGFASETRGQTVQFSRKLIPEYGAFLKDDVLYFNEYGKTTRLFPRADILIPGIHHTENYLAAISAVWGEVGIEAMRHVAKTFPGVEHRTEFVRELDEVKWYNDSIATSPTRVIAALNAFPQKIIMIGGGYDKKVPFDDMANLICTKVKNLILMGMTAQKIQEAVMADPLYDSTNLPIQRVDNMEEAVTAAQRVAKPGDIIALLPAGASFDLYPMFEVRGQHFKSLVNALSSKKSD